jgi:hypothetical protein
MNGDIQGALEPNFPFTVAALIKCLRAVFDQLPDVRASSNNQRYAMADAALSAFSVFFTQSPSFLDYQIRMQQQQGKNNAQTLFGVHQIPSDNQIRNILDPVEPHTLFALITHIGDELYRNQYLESYRSINNTFLVAVDGTDFFSSHTIHCECCSSAKQKNGDTVYRHIAVTPVLVAPGKEQVVALAPEFVHPQDGHDKQDCELAATGRWLTQWSAHYAAWRITMLGDDLYCHQPFCQRVLQAQMNFCFTCKPDSHPVLYEWVADFTRTGQIGTLVRTRRTAKKRLTDTYRFLNEVPLRDSDDALLVSWCELITTSEDGTVRYRNAWASSHRIDEHNVELLVKAARARWKIENEGNNTLKTKGYHFEHNFGHGKQHLANLFATMILLAYLMHTSFDWIDERYRAVRRALPSRTTFFEHVRALLLYLPFDSWDHLLRFMLSKLNAPDTG